MNFLKNIFENKKSKPELIHEKFSYTNDGFWFWNKKWDTPIPPEYKIGFAFNDKDLLNGCEFICKIGKNTENKEFKYYGLIFGSDKVTSYTQQEVISYVNKFDQKTLFDDLDHNGISNNLDGVPIQ
jgi:hypothetical protein